jgi:hypothetical protein
LKITGLRATPQAETRASPPADNTKENTPRENIRERTTKKPHRTTTHTNQRSTENVLLERRLEIMALAIQFNSTHSRIGPARQSCLSVQRKANGPNLAASSNSSTYISFFYRFSKPGPATHTTTRGKTHPEGNTRARAFKNPHPATTHPNQLNRENTFPSSS